MLKKLDFGDNSLGDTGIDIFARVYTQSELDFVNTSSSEEEEQDEDPMLSASMEPSDSRQSSSHRRKSSQAKGKQPVLVMFHKQY